MSSHRPQVPCHQGRSQSPRPRARRRFSSPLRHDTPEPGCSTVTPSRSPGGVVSCRMPLIPSSLSDRIEHPADPRNQIQDTASTELDKNGSPPFALNIPWNPASARKAVSPLRSATSVQILLLRICVHLWFSAQRQAHPHRGSLPPPGIKREGASDGNRHFAHHAQAHL